MDAFGTCLCGHSQDEHGLDKKYPGSTMCLWNPEHGEYDGRGDCDCIAYESEDET